MVDIHMSKEGGKETKKRRSKRQKQSSVYRIMPLPNITSQHLEYGESSKLRITIIQIHHNITIPEHE